MIKGKSAPRVSIVVPVFNEARDISANLDLLLREAEASFEQFEILVVSDGSTDGTEARVFALADPRLRLIVSPVNSGKGHAVRRGFQEAKGELVFFIDGGMELHPRALGLFRDLRERTDADIVIGSKRHPDSKVHYPLSRRLLSRVYQTIVRTLFGVNFTDTQVGLKLFRREVIDAVLPDLRIDRYGFDLEILTLAKLRGYTKVVEAPVQMDYFLRGKRNLTREFAHVARVGLHLMADTIRLRARISALQPRRPAPFKTALIVLLFAILAIAYLSPGFDPVFEGDRSKVMSDGTDAATLPYQYGVLLETVRENPGDLLYGAVPARHLNAPDGYALWIPWSERILVLMSAVFTPLEHLSTVYVAILFFVNAICMFALGRALGWSRTVALAMALAWAFCPFTRARAQVHAGFAGTYHVPLAMLAALWALRGRPLWRSALGFLAVAMAPHYFVITLAALSPFVLWIARAFTPRPLWKNLFMALIPMVVFLGWCYLQPLPADLPAADAHPPSGATADGSVHPFLTVFAAHPIDYFTGDIALGPRDPNPLRAELSEGVLADLANANPHERANGIRWIAWLLAVGALLRWPAESRRARWAVVALGAAAFWLSMPPPGPSQWLNAVISQIRVPSRAGIYVHFAVLIAAGTFAQKLNRKFILVLPLLMVLELPPFWQDMRMSGVRPPLTSLTGECGTGMYYPYVAGNWGVLESYHFLQEMRGTSCGIINRQWPNAASEKLYAAIGLRLETLRAFNAQELLTFRRLEHVATCAGLSFLVFDPRTTLAARANLCTQWGGLMSEDRVCKKPPRPLIKNPAECL